MKSGEKEMDAPPAVLKNQRLMQEVMNTGTDFHPMVGNKPVPLQILESWKVPENVRDSKQFDPKEILTP